MWVTQHLRRTIPCAMILCFNCAETKMTLHLIYSLIPIGCSALLRPGKVSCYTLLMATLMDTFSCHILHLNPGLLTGHRTISCLCHHLTIVPCTTSALSPLVRLLSSRSSSQVPGSYVRIVMILPILILINLLNFGNIANNCKSCMNVQSPSLLPPPPPGRDVARRTRADSYGQWQWAGARRGSTDNGVSGILSQSGVASKH